MMRNILAVSTFCLVFALLFLSAEPYASEAAGSGTDSGSTAGNTLKENEAAVKDARNARSALDQGRSAAESELSGLKSTLGTIEEAMAELDRSMTGAQEALDVLEAELKAKQEELEEAEAALQAAEEDFDRQYEAMKKRIRFIYEGGRETMLQVLFSSSSFAEFLNKEEYINKIAEYDERKLGDFLAARAALDKAREKLEEERLELEEAREAEEQKRAEYEAALKKKEEEAARYEALIGTKEQQIAEYRSMIAAQDAEIAALEKAIEAEKQRLAALEAEKNRRKYDGGKFTFPCPSYTRISDDYGMRIHPTLGVETMHNGIDLAAPSGSDILAAYDGTVVGSAYSATMGNYVMIDHGDGLYTVYMHASRLLVSVGQSVSRGQKIALVGSTGRSTGPHLHFGVRLNGSYVSPWRYLK